MHISKIGIENETTENVVALIQLSAADLRRGQNLAKITLRPALKELSARYKKSPSTKDKYSEVFNALAKVQDIKDEHEVAEALKNTKAINYTPPILPNPFRS